MKIQAINNQISSKGLYIDRSKENKGNWKMVYKPYSWELNNDAKPYIAPKQQINMFDSILPINEEFYTGINGKEPARSKDIHGTISYYKYPPEINNGEMRKNVIQEEAMDREESLEVYKRKLGFFESLKKHQLKYELPDKVDLTRVKYHHYSFGSYSSDYNNNFFGKNSNKDKMVSAEKDLFKEAEALYLNAQNYIKMATSIEELKGKINEIDNELKLIKHAKQNGLAIDISKRDSDDADAPLKEFIEKVANSNKPLEEFEEWIILPNGIRKFKEMISSLHHYAGSNAIVNLKSAGLTDYCKERFLDFTHYIIKYR